MSRLLFNRDGGSANEYGHLLALARSLAGDIIEGFQVQALGTPAMSVVVGPGSAKIATGTYPSSYAYFVSIDTSTGTPAGESVTITTANASNPRIDTIVAYVDLAVTPSSATPNNPNNMLKLAAVAGTPAATPAAPTTSTIQSAIGASNPYIVLAQVAVGTSVTQITSANITDLRNFVSPVAAPGLTGWTAASEAWTYASSTTVNVPSNATDKYDPGDYVQFVQAGTLKQYVIQLVTATTLTLAGVQGTTSVANTAISRPYYSKARTPHGVNVMVNQFLPFLTSYTNGGSGGGTFYYINLGGIKLLWGLTASFAVGAANSATPVVTFPVGWFNSIQSIVATVQYGANGGNSFANIATGGYSTTSATITVINNGASTATAQQVFLVVVGS